MTPRPREPAETLERATPAQAKALAGLRTQFWADQQAKGLLDVPPALDPTTVAALITRARTSIFMAWQNGEAIGYVFGQTKLVPGPTPKKVSSIEEIFLAPGRRGGAIARALFDFALQDFREQQTDRVQLRVLDNNEEGRRFWERVGFRPNVVVYELDFH